MQALYVGLHPFGWQLWILMHPGKERRPRRKTRGVEEEEAISINLTLLSLSHFFSSRQLFLFPPFSTFFLPAAEGRQVLE